LYFGTCEFGKIEHTLNILGDLPKKKLKKDKKSIRSCISEETPAEAIVQNINMPSIETHTERTKK